MNPDQIKRTNFCIQVNCEKNQCRIIVFYFNFLVYSVQHPNDINSWQMYGELEKHQDPYTLPTPLIVIQAGYYVETHQV